MDSLRNSRVVTASPRLQGRARGFHEGPERRASEEGHRALEVAVLNDLKAEFGVAYVRAVAHAAGFFVQER